MAGDLLALVLFAIIGRINHGEILDLETLTTVLPFWLGTVPWSMLPCQSAAGEGSTSVAGVRGRGPWQGSRACYPM